MKKHNNYIRIGIVGLVISLVINLVFRTSVVESEIVGYTIPWLVFLIIGLSIRLRYVRK